MTKFFKIFQKLIYIELLFISTLLFDIYLLFRLKYKNNNLSFDEFNLSNLGNLINLILTILLIIGLFILFGKKNVIINKIKSLSFLIIGITLPLIVLVIIFISDVSFAEKYFLQYPLRKVIIAFIFGISEFLKIFTLAFIWYLIFSRRDYLFIRAFFISLIIVGSLIFLSFFYYLFFNTDKFNSDFKNKKDIAVVLGAAVWSNNEPSPIFEGRLKKAYELYKNGIIKKIQLTGGNAPGEISEAEAGYNYLEKLGVDKTDILLEQQTSTTTEQIFYIKKKIIETMNFDEVVIISDAFHLIRVNEICNFYNVKATLCTSSNNIDWKELLLYKAKDSIELLLFWLFAVQ